MKRSPLRKVATRRTASASDRLQDRNRKQRRNMFLERLEDRSLMATMLCELERTGGRFGLQTMCEGGGMANATIIERLG